MQGLKDILRSMQTTSWKGEYWRQPAPGTRGMSDEKHTERLFPGVYGDSRALEHRGLQGDSRAWEHHGLPGRDRALEHHGLPGRDRALEHHELPGRDRASEHHGLLRRDRALEHHGLLGRDRALEQHGLPGRDRASEHREYDLEKKIKGYMDELKKNGRRDHRGLVRRPWRE